MMRRLFAAMYDTVGKGSEEAGMREERRQLPALVLAVDHESRRQAAWRQALDNRVGLVAEYDDDILDFRLEEGPDDPGEKRFGAAERERRLRPPHPRRLAGREHDRGNHRAIVLRPMQKCTSAPCTGARQSVLRSAFLDSCILDSPARIQS